MLPLQSYSREIINGTRKYPFPTPLTPGYSAIGRIAEVGPDATKLKSGDLVFIDCTTRSRDEPGDIILAGVASGFSAGSQKLMNDVWRDWTWAEYCRAPLENLTLLDEHRLTSKDCHGYSISSLTYAATLLVPYGGLRDINLQAGETVIVSPATGPFGGAAVHVALAMGAKVIAMGRNTSILQHLQQTCSHPNRVEIVPITSDMIADFKALKQANNGQDADAFFDIGPPEAAQSTHLRSAIMALRQGGRVSLMGGYGEDMPLPHRVIMRKNLMLKGKWMYEPSDRRDLFKMIEHGVLDLSSCEVVGEYGLDDVTGGVDAAAEKGGPGKVVVLKP